MAVTRHTLASFASIFADSITVFGSATIARLSQVRTGLALGIAAFGVLPKGGCAPRPPFGALLPPPGPLPLPCCAAVCPAAAITRITDRTRAVYRTAVFLLRAGCLAPITVSLSFEMNHVCSRRSNFALRFRDYRLAALELLNEPVEHRGNVVAAPQPDKIGMRGWSRQVAINAAAHAQVLTE